MDTRAAAATAIAGTLGQNTRIDQALEPVLRLIADARDRALVRELCYGTLRWYYRFEFLLRQLLSHPLNSRDADIQALLMCGLYQLDCMRVPDHAAVSATVQAARELDKPWATNLINAVLRRYQRERENLSVAVMQHPIARYAHPGWFIEAVQADWPGHWEAILEANNAHPPMHLRVNRRKTGRDDYLRELADAGWISGAAAMAENGVWLEGAADVDQIPGFTQGRVSVQDFAAQLAAPLLGAAPGERVLDACAAPGGKTAHILELNQELAELVALDLSPPRIARVSENLQRLGLKATVIEGDACTPGAWWDRKPFHKILLDAPCSATGVIRRHPDIKVRRRHSQLARYARKQRELLAALWPLLAAGGTLVYATCSLLHRENDAVIQDFMNNHKDAHSAQIDSSWGIATTLGRQTLPGMDNMDGFYYARLRKS